MPFFQVPEPASFRIANRVDSCDKNINPVSAAERKLAIYPTVLQPKEETAERMQACL